ncbi:MAG: hypothetical protein WC955_12375 [Elusimicrobiota bacterium]
MKFKDNVELTKYLEKNFDKLREMTYKKYGGPSVYFHIQSMKMLRKCKTSGQYLKLLKNEHFVELVYASVASWGMQRMGGLGMVDFEDFKEEILKNKVNLVKLSTSRLSKISEVEKDILGDIFDRMEIMKSDSRLVSNSKLLHHLLPELVPPMDRAHVLKYFHKHLSTKNIKKERLIFFDIIDKYRELLIDLKVKPKNKYDFDTSEIKMVDNALMGIPKDKLTPKKKKS